MSCQVRDVVTGVGFTEGPLWTSDGRLLCVSMSRGCILEVDLEQGSAKSCAETGGGPNGLCESADGSVWIAQSGRRREERPVARRVPPGIQRWRPSAAVEDFLMDEFDSPNDCAMGPDGRMWFTDPRGPALEGDPEPGRVCALDTRKRRADVVLEGAMYPNGLAFGPGGSQLYVAETAAQRIVRYRVAGEGLSGGEEFAAIAPGKPDGIAFDSEGNLYVAATTADEVVVLDSSGGVSERIRVGASFPTNVCFGGREMTTLFITAARGGRVLAVEGRIPGLPLLR